jgi:hypothetical protein
MSEKQSSPIEGGSRRPDLHDHQSLQKRDEICDILNAMIEAQIITAQDASECIRCMGGNIPGEWMKKFQQIH